MQQMKSIQGARDKMVISQRNISNIKFHDIKLTCIQLDIQLQIHIYPKINNYRERKQLNKAI